MRGLLLNGSVPAQLGVSLGLVLARSRVGSTSHEDVGREGVCGVCVSEETHLGSVEPETSRPAGGRLGLQRHRGQKKPRAPLMVWGPLRAGRRA